MTEEALRRSLADWIMEAALNGADMKALIDGASSRLLASGVPVTRSNIIYRTLHPLFEATSLLWQQDGQVQVREFVHGSTLRTSWPQSPFAFLLDRNLPLLRRRLTGPEANLDFPVLHELVGEGLTDYLVLSIPFDSSKIHMLGAWHDGILVSFATDRVGGFTNEHLRTLQQVSPRLGVGCKLAIREQIAGNVARTYLGTTAGEQVLGGHIKLGDYETINAVVWFADLRDSTGRSERLGMERYLALLNGFMECAAGAVQANMGEILAYPGDSVLAIFRDTDGFAAAESAFAAAAECRRRLFDVNENLIEMEQEPLRAGVALHRGDLAFGNIGTGGRQAFTVIGPAVSVVTRMEAMTKTEPYQVILSGDVASLLPDDAPALYPMGPRQVRGSETPVTIYGLNDRQVMPYRAPDGYAEIVMEPLSVK